MHIVMLICFLTLTIFTMSIYMFIYSFGHRTPAKTVFLQTIKDDPELKEIYKRITTKRLQVYLMGGLLGSLAVIILGSLKDFKPLRKDSCLQLLTIMAVQFITYMTYEYKEYMADVLKTEAQIEAYEELKEEMMTRYRLGLLIGVLASLLGTLK